jgi:uncharacterized membrane protein
MARYLDYFYILGTIVLTVYGQLILKWRISSLGPVPVELLPKLKCLSLLLFDPFIFSGLFAAVLASLTWMAAMTRFELSHAYPFMSLNFVVVLFLSALLLNEPLTTGKLLGVGLIVLGTVVVSRA